MTIKLYLASASPRRKELLTQLGYDFEQFSIDADETKFSNERDLYIAIWKIKFKKEISKEGNKDDVLDYVTGNKKFV